MFPYKLKDLESSDHAEKWRGQKSRCAKQSCLSCTHHPSHLTIYNIFSASSISLSTWNPLSPLVNIFSNSPLPLPSSLCT